MTRLKGFSPILNCAFLPQAGVPLGCCRWRENGRSAAMIFPTLENLVANPQFHPAPCWLGSERPGRRGGSLAPHFRTKMCLARRQTRRARHTRSREVPIIRSWAQTRLGIAMIFSTRDSFSFVVSISYGPTGCCPARPIGLSRQRAFQPLAADPGLD